MKKMYRVKSKHDFQNIINQGKKIYNKNYVIYYLPNNLKYPRFGITVSKRIGNAVLRNKIKRQIRSIIQNHQKDFLYSNDYIIIVKSSCINLNYATKISSLLNIITTDKGAKK